MPVNRPNIVGIYDLFKGIACERKRKNEKGKKKGDYCLLFACATIS